MSMMMSRSHCQASIKRGLLLEAIEAKDETLVQELLSEGTLNVDDLLESGTTPLMEAIQRGQESMVKALVTLGASVTQPHPVRGRTLWMGGLGKSQHQIYPLQAAVDGQNGYIIQLLLSHGSCIDHCNKGLQGLFNLAVCLNCENLVNILFLMGKQREQNAGLLHTTVDLSRPLLTAVQLGKVNMACLLLELGADLNRETEGMLPLVAAASNKDQKMCELLLAHGATLGKTTGTLANCHTPLSLAIMAGMLDAVTYLIKLGSDVNSITDSTASEVLGRRITGRSMLHHAVAKRNLPIVRKLVEAGSRLNCEEGKSGNGNTPMHVACLDQSEQSTEIVEYFLQFCPGKAGESPVQAVDGCSDIIDINSKNSQGQTPLMLAVTCRNVDCAAMLIKAGADLEVRDKLQLTALHHAVQRGSDILVDNLLQAGCSVNAYKKNCPTPLHEAIRNNDLTIVDILLDYNAEIQPCTVHKETALHLAVQSRGEELVEKFLELGLDLNAKTQNGDTPLMIAARQDGADICRMLVTSGASMDCHDHNQQETALILSVYFGFENNAQVLIAHGADLNATDKRNTSALYWSIFNARIKCLLFLIMAGTKLTKRDLDNTPSNLTVCKNQCLFKWMLDMVTSVRPLQDLCRLSIREALRRHNPGRDILQHVEKLTLPSKLKAFLGYQTEELADALEHVSQASSSPSSVSDGDSFDYHDY